MLLTFQQNAKELRQFLGCNGYYRNHINLYAEVINTLTNVCIAIRHSCGQQHIEIPSQSLMMLTNNAIPIYSDPGKPYVLFHRCLKYCSAAMLCQYISEDDNLDYLKSITSC